MVYYSLKDALIWEASLVKVRTQEVIVTINMTLFTLGEFGVVYRGTLNNWKDDNNLVAIKTLKGCLSHSIQLKYARESYSRNV